MSDFGRGCLILTGMSLSITVVRSLSSRSEQHLIVVMIRPRGYSGPLLLSLTHYDPLT